MEIMKYKDFEGTAELDTELGICHGRILFITDLITYESDSPRDIKRQFELAVDDYIETCESLGREVKRPFKGLFNVRIPPELHREATIKAISEGVKLNEIVVKAIENYLHGPSTTPTRQIYVSRPKQIEIAVSSSVRIPGSRQRLRKGVSSAH